MTASPTTSPTTNSVKTIVPVLSGPCTSTLAILLARTAFRVESADGLPDRFVQTRLSPTITGCLAVSVVLSRRVKRTLSGLESALNRCGCKDVVCHDVQAVKNVQATSRATADTNSCCGGRGRISCPAWAVKDKNRPSDSLAQPVSRVASLKTWSAPRGLLLLSAFQYAPLAAGRNHWTPRGGATPPASGAACRHPRRSSHGSRHYALVRARW